MTGGDVLKFCLWKTVFFCPKNGDLCIWDYYIELLLSVVTQILPVEEFFLPDKEERRIPEPGLFLHRCVLSLIPDPSAAPSSSPPVAGRAWLAPY